MIRTENDYGFPFYWADQMSLLFGRGGVTRPTARLLGMYAPRILHNHPFSLSDTTVRILDHAWSADAEYERMAETAWQVKLREAERDAQTLWDGTYYRVSNTSDIAGPMGVRQLELGTIQYRYIATFRRLHEEHERRKLAPLHHLSTAALIRTNDAHYVFGRRSRGGAIDLIGGGVQRDEMEISCGADIGQNVYKEIREEIGIQYTDSLRMNGMGVLMSSTSNILVIAHIDLRLSRVEVADRFANREEDEMVEPVIVPESDLRSFLYRLTDYRMLIPDLLR